MRSINILTLMIIAITCMQACSSKDYEHCDNTLVPKASADSLVYAGDSLHLTVSGIDAYICIWRGPNGYYTQEKNPVISNVSAANAGRYTVDVFTKTGCIYTATTDSVKVRAITPPCTLKNNYAEFSNTFDVSYYWVGGSISGGSYFVTANGSDGDLEMEFAGASRPVTGIYTTQYLGGPWAQGNVRIRATNSGWAWYPVSDSKVYVNTAGGKLVVSFCNMDFTYQTYKSKINLQVTVP